MQKDTVGTTHCFVLAQGFTKAGCYAALIGADGTKRLFAELYADPDRPEVRPQEAYQAILSSMQPGWTVRFLQLFWPNPEPRLAFQKQVERWDLPTGEGLAILYQGLSLSIQEQLLPFIRRTILEFVVPGNEGVAWWEGLSGLCQGFGLRFFPLTAEEILVLSRRILDPNLS